MKLWCVKCYRLTEHGDIADIGDHTWPGGPPAHRVMGLCLRCGQRDDRGSFVVAGASQCAKPRMIKRKKPWQT